MRSTSFLRPSTSLASFSLSSVRVLISSFLAAIVVTCCWIWPSSAGCPPSLARPPLERSRCPRPRPPPPRPLSLSPPPPSLSPGLSLSPPPPPARRHHQPRRVRASCQSSRRWWALPPRNRSPSAPRRPQAPPPAAPAVLSSSVFDYLWHSGSIWQTSGRQMLAKWRLLGKAGAASKRQPTCHSFATLTSDTPPCPSLPNIRGSSADSVTDVTKCPGSLDVGMGP